VVDVVREVEAISRSVGEGRVAAGEGKLVHLQRTYAAGIDEVWDALTTPARLSRWFLPVSGDFRVGGSYQFEGQAGGTILECQRPNLLRATWVYGDASDPASTSEVEVRLTAVDDDSTVFELLHTAVVPDELWSQFGPGAVGVGWDMGLLGLSMHLGGGDDAVATPEQKMEWQLSSEGIEFATRSSEAWGAASRAAGLPDDLVAQNVAATTAFYTTVPDSETAPA
jgi:uncharacterized protein YndB with AHSA1/START domain